MGSIPVAILSSYKDMKTIASQLHKHEYSRVVTIRNTCGPVGLDQYGSLEEYCGPHTASSVFLILLVSLSDSQYVPYQTY